MRFARALILASSLFASGCCLVLGINCPQPNDAANYLYSVGLTPKPNETPRQLLQRFVNENVLSYVTLSNGTEVDLRSYSFEVNVPGSIASAVTQSLSFWAKAAGGVAGATIVPGSGTGSVGLNANYKVLFDMPMGRMYRMRPDYLVKVDPRDPVVPPGLPRELFLVESGKAIMVEAHHLTLSGQTENDTLDIKINGSSESGHASEFKWAVIGQATSKVPSPDELVLSSRHVLAPGQSRRLNLSGDMQITLDSIASDSLGKIATVSVGTKKIKLRPGYYTCLDDRRHTAVAWEHPVGGTEEAPFVYYRVAPNALKRLGFRVAFDEGEKTPLPPPPAVSIEVTSKRTSAGKYCGVRDTVHVRIDSNQMPSARNFAVHLAANQSAAPIRGPEPRLAQRYAYTCQRTAIGFDVSYELVGDGYKDPKNRPYLLNDVNCWRVSFDYTVDNQPRKFSQAFYSKRRF